MECWNDKILTNKIHYSSFPKFHYSKTNHGGITMNKKISIITILIILFIGIELAIAGAKVTKLSGEVNIRRGVEEDWQPASDGILLEDIDTILTGADGVVVLQTNDGIKFELGNNSILDISDLRKISEKELFLYLMSKKVQKIEPRNGKTRLRIGKVSVVHGESKVESENVPGNNSKSDFLIQEKNGARALHEQSLYPNSIIKYHKILEKYDAGKDCGEIHFYLGKSFEALNQIGQAIDAYQEAIDQLQQPGCDNPNAKKWSAEAKQAIEKLKQKK